MSERENGMDSDVRNFGRLCLALIPWALGIGAAVWLGVWITGHDFRHQLSQEDRAAVYTGAEQRPKSKVVITIIPRDCTEVTRADIDGSALLIYARNDCHKRLDYMEWHWQSVSPNGTVLKDGYTNGDCPKAVEPGDVAECHMNIDADDRAEVLRVWTTIMP